MVSGKQHPRWVAATLVATLILIFEACGGGSASSNPGNSGAVALGSSQLNFGTVPVGSSKTLQNSITNSTGSSVTLASLSGTGPTFQVSGITFPAVLAAGQTLFFNVQFQPANPGQQQQNFQFLGNGNQQYAALAASGDAVTPGTLAANPTSLSFGSVQVGNNATLKETITNTGGSSVNINSASVGNAAYSISGLTLPLNLAAGVSVTFDVTFAPGAPGSGNSTLTLVSDANPPTLTIPLSGTGTAAGQLGVSPTTLNFGNVVVGTSSTLNSTLGASGAPVTVSSANSSSSEFTISGLTPPVTIAAGKSQQYSVTFTPQASGTATATLTFVSNASNSPTQQSLTGTGQPAPQHSVSLSWNASISQGVVGYNIYRGIVSGGPYSVINTSLDSSTSYTDAQVVPGDTYYYVTAAVNGSGQESGYSNEAQAIIPKP